MSNKDFRIEWDLHELGDKPKTRPPQARPQLHGPTDAERLAFALALATGAIPANAPAINRVSDKGKRS